MIKTLYQPTFSYFCSKMSSAYTCHIENVSEFREQLISWTGQHPRACLLNSNAFAGDRYTSFDCLAGIGVIDELFIDEAPAAFEKIKAFQNKHKGCWIMGALSYDLKNSIEQLSSENEDELDFPLAHFFCPKTLIRLKGDQLTIESFDLNVEEIGELLSRIMEEKVDAAVALPKLNIQHRLSKEAYCHHIGLLKDHIAYGDVYEINYCQEFYCEQAQLDATVLYRALNKISPTPFSCYYRIEDKHILSSSPERFLRKTGQKIISQPIKGTIGRGTNSSEDDEQKRRLYNNLKDQTENIMIVDLVRNDLSRTAKIHSVQVEELFGIYSFNQVHQMISTVSSELKEDIHIIDAIKESFPMGSMTGAPKIKAMELIEKYEPRKRGLFSGSIGYIDPDENFDFSVIIRTALYNASRQYLSFMAGGAITARSEATAEYEECLLKAKAFFELFEQDSARQ